MQVRRARESDAAGIARVQVRTWQAAYRGIVPDDYLDGLSVPARIQAWSDGLARGEPQEVWVATIGPDVAGWIAFGRSRDPHSLVTTAELEAVYVSAEHWGTGLGRALWSKARDRLAELGYSRVTLWVLLENTRAIRFYRVAGFTPDPQSEKTIVIGGRPLMEIRYQASLE